MEAKIGIICLQPGVIFHGGNFGKSRLSSAISLPLLTGLAHVLPAWCLEGYFILTSIRGFDRSSCRETNFADEAEEEDVGILASDGGREKSMTSGSLESFWSLTIGLCVDVDDTAVALGWLTALFLNDSSLVLGLLRMYFLIPVILGKKIIIWNFCFNTMFVWKPCGNRKKK